ncbi:MAG TPA: hypothetical protein VKT82_21605 [Ktedonobacterales bacterium]|nr:hypothetical protein [Ktedonobacterales bacterium]
MLRYSKQQISAMMSRFIWNYSVGDNIAYNFKVLFALYEDKSRSAVKNIYNKPLIILIVSIIECLMYDFVVRLEQATNQWPQSIPPSKRELIKARLSSEKVKKQVEYLDQQMTIQTVRNYSMDQLIKLFKEFELFGPKDHEIYPRFVDATRLRNRVHIFNWFNNFERKERDTYSEQRLEGVEQLLDGLLEYMSETYYRPDSQPGDTFWLRDMGA